MIPIRDENPRVHPPIATVAIIALNALAWVLLQGLGTETALTRSICLYGLVPGDLLGTAAVGSQIADGQRHRLRARRTVRLDHDHLVDVHARRLAAPDRQHVVSVDLRRQRRRRDGARPLRRLLSAVRTRRRGAQMLADPASIVPMVGASGAIGGVMGAYALLYPRAHVHMFIFLGFYMTTVAVPAIYMLGYWFLLQLLSGLPGLAGEQVGGVAFWAHVGGFVAGSRWCCCSSNARASKRVCADPARRTARHRWF